MLIVMCLMNYLYFLLVVLDVVYIFVLGYLYIDLYR